MNNALQVPGSSARCRVQLTLRLSRAKPGWVLNKQVQAEFRFRERLRQQRGAHMQNAILKGNPDKGHQGRFGDFIPPFTASAAANRIL